MTVEQLISILQDCDPKAEVLLASQPTYPFEYRLAGVTVRVTDAGGTNLVEIDMLVTADAVTEVSAT